MEIENNYVICINGDRYAIDLEKIKEFCLTSDKEKAKEQELIENYEQNDSTGSLDMTSKISREVKSTGNPQNDSIVYDMVKLFISTLLSNDLSSIGYYTQMDFKTALCFNTLVKAGILYKF